MYQAKFLRQFLPAAAIALLLSVPGFAQLNLDRTKTEKGGDGNQTQTSEAYVVDGSLAVVRSSPSLYSEPVERLEVGSKILVLGTKEADGVVFYEVRLANTAPGWVQSEALIGKFKRNDDQRLVKMIQAADGFVQIRLSAVFLELFDESPLRPSILLLTGDLLEEAATSLSREASTELVRRKMAASGAPLHSFYLNFRGLDRYTSLGFRFLFNLDTMSYHYDGAGWIEITQKHPGTAEAREAEDRLNSLRTKMAAK